MESIKERKERMEMEVRAELAVEQRLKERKRKSRSGNHIQLEECDKIALHSTGQDFNLHFTDIYGAQGKVKMKEVDLRWLVRLINENL